MTVTVIKAAKLCVSIYSPLNSFSRFVKKKNKKINAHFRIAIVDESNCAVFASLWELCVLCACAIIMFLYIR